MVALRVAIHALDTVSIILGMIPLVGDTLESAVKLASEICEQIQVRPNSLRCLTKEDDDFDVFGNRT
jgi:hypothetical protein